MVISTTGGLMAVTSMSGRNSSLIEVIACQSSTIFHLQIKLFLKFDILDIYLEPLENTTFKFISYNLVFRLNSLSMNFYQVLQRNRETAGVFLRQKGKYT